MGRALSLAENERNRSGKPRELFWFELSADNLFDRAARRTTQLLGPTGLCSANGPIGSSLRAKVAFFRVFHTGLSGPDVSTTAVASKGWLDPDRRCTV